MMMAMAPGSRVIPDNLCLEASWVYCWSLACDMQIAPSVKKKDLSEQLGLAAKLTAFMRFNSHVGSSAWQLLHDMQVKTTCPLCWPPHSCEAAPQKRSGSLMRRNPGSAAHNVF